MVFHWYFTSVFVVRKLVTLPRRNNINLQKQKLKVHCNGSINTSLCADQRPVSISPNKTETETENK